MSELTISREALYELVWSKPTTIVAREFRVSDVAVIKVCRKLNVPRPPRGYWARRRYGYAVMDAPPLPARNDETPSEHTFTAAVDRPAGTSRPMGPAIVAIPKSSREPHPALTGIRAALAKLRPDSFGRVGPSDTGINVSPSMVSRAVKVLSVLFAVLEERGHAIKCDGNDLGIVVCGETVPIAAFESANRVKVRIGRPSDGYERWDYKPSGLLTLKTWIPYVYGARREWSDRKNLPLEERLGDIVAAIEHAPTIIAAERRAREIRATRDAREELEERRASDVPKFTRERAAKTNRMLTNFDRAARIRGLIAAIESRVDAPASSRRLARWAVRYADHLDPLVDYRIPELEIKGDSAEWLDDDD